MDTKHSTNLQSQLSYYRKKHEEKNQKIQEEKQKKLKQEKQKQQEENHKKKIALALTTVPKKVCTQKGCGVSFKDAFVMGYQFKILQLICVMCPEVLKKNIGKYLIVEEIHYFWSCLGLKIVQSPELFGYPIGIEQKDIVYPKTDKERNFFFRQNISENLEKSKKLFMDVKEKPRFKVVKKLILQDETKEKKLWVVPSSYKSDMENIQGKKKKTWGMDKPKKANTKKAHKKDHRRYRNSAEHYRHVQAGCDEASEYMYGFDIDWFDGIDDYTHPTFRFDSNDDYWGRDTYDSDDDGYFGPICYDHWY